MYQAIVRRVGGLVYLHKFTRHIHIDKHTHTDRRLGMKEVNVILWS